MRLRTNRPFKPSRIGINNKLNLNILTKFSHISCWRSRSPIFFFFWGGLIIISGLINFLWFIVNPIPSSFHILTPYLIQFKSPMNTWKYFIYYFSFLKSATWEKQKYPEEIKDKSEKIPGIPPVAHNTPPPP